MKCSEQETGLIANSWKKYSRNEGFILVFRIYGPWIDLKEMIPSKKNKEINQKSFETDYVEKFSMFHN